MKARNLISVLNKFSTPETDVTIVLDNSEKNFEVLSAQNSAGKIILVLTEVVSISDVQAGEHLETEKERTVEPVEAGTVEDAAPTIGDLIVDLDTTPAPDVIDPVVTEEGAVEDSAESTENKTDTITE